MTDITVTPRAAPRPFASTRNACRLCAPLGACIVFRGVEGCIPLIHGSQGCSTYIRRYGISHFREPIDIASSNFTEASAIFGGRANLETAIENVTRQYSPKVIGITSTCLSETIGENVPMYLSEFRKTHAEPVTAESERPELVYASTPSYRGSHMDGFHEAICSLVQTLVPRKTMNASTVSDDSGTPVASRTRINVISGFVSTEDLRELHDIMLSYDVPYTLLPDYSETLDGGSWTEYQKLPEGGTPVEDIRKMGEAAGTLYLSRVVPKERDAGKWLESECGVALRSLYLPVGIEETDNFFRALEDLTGKKTPVKWMKIRGRLVDAYIDGHKYCAGKKAIVYGEEDFVCSMVSFLDEIGIAPVIIATGSPSPDFAERIKPLLRNSRTPCRIMDDADFATIVEAAKGLDVDIAIGNSKGQYITRNLDVPLVRCGFPVHDRMGGQRILHLGYRGTLNLFDMICNALMQEKQDAAKSGYTYI